MERQRKAFYRALKPAIDRKDVLAQPKDGERRTTAALMVGHFPVLKEPGKYVPRRDINLSRDGTLSHRNFIGLTPTGHMCVFAQCPMTGHLNLS
jgi:hypothetical protein